MTNYNNIDYRITDHFSYNEFIRSTTAEQRHIDNTMPKRYNANLVTLCEKVLEPIRQEYGKPIIITSGYRCEKLNKAINGAKTSDHKFGAACDCVAQDGDNLKLWNVVMKMVKEGKLDCRQIIWEYGDKQPNWIHLSINHKYNGMRNNQILRY